MAPVQDAPYTLDMTITTMKTLRKRAGLTQVQLGAAIGVAANTIARWERGEMQPNKHSLAAAIAYLERVIEKGESVDE